MADSVEFVINLDMTGDQGLQNDLMLRLMMALQDVNRDRYGIVRYCVTMRAHDRPGASVEEVRDAVYTGLRGVGTWHNVQTSSVSGVCRCGASSDDPVHRNGRQA